MLAISAQDDRLTYFAPQAVDRQRSELRLDRFPRECQQLLHGQIGPLANLRSSSGCRIGFATDSPWVVLELARLRHHQSCPVGIDLQVQLPDGRWHTTPSGDLRSQNGDIRVRFATGLERGGQLRPVWLELPLISVCAITGIRLTKDSQLAPIPAPEPQWLAIGDSLTQGFTVEQPGQHWLSLLSQELDKPAWNLGIGGLRIQAEVFTWALAQQNWPLITVGLGSNHAWSDDGPEQVAAAADALIHALLERPHGRIVWLMPGWKPLEDGKGPPDFMGVPLNAAAAERLRSIRQSLQERLSPHTERISLVELAVPKDARLFPDGLHPQAPAARLLADALRPHVEDKL